MKDLYLRILRRSATVIRALAFYQCAAINYGIIDNVSISRLMRVVFANCAE